jgi:hypothetical protein
LRGNEFFVFGFYFFQISRKNRLQQVTLHFRDIDSPVVIHGFLKMGYNNLSGKDRVIIGDIGITESRPVF